MNELMTKEGELTTADLASHGTAQKQPNEPKLVKGPEPGSSGKTSGCSLRAHALVF